MMADTLELASSSSSSSQSWNHDVFLSFRGEDTRKIFVDHLYRALGQQAINTYRDDEELIKGALIVDQLMKTIQESRIAIIVFSKSYASSRWCLEELVQIMENMHKRGQIVMPIFHGVDPSELRIQKGIYGEALKKHAKFVIPAEKVGSWREALVAASNLAGWVTNGEEPRCIKYVVDTVSNTLFPNKDLVVLQGVDHLKIPLQKLKSATNNFSKDYFITKGGFGEVYKAQYEDGIVAIKKLDRMHGQGHPQFMMEIALLSAYKHKNLVSLVGFCDQGGEKILVYEYESNGSLDQHLHRKDIRWIQRIQICLDAARGLKYLHDDIGIQHRILHRDIKSSNILLDGNLKAKISDFGLSKVALANVPVTLVITGACGTPGYIDPEYFKHGILTQKSDVYSFGVVMFEVLCGKLVDVSKNPRVPFSAEMAQNHYQKGALDEIIDPNLRSQINPASFDTFTAVANQCLKSLGQDRPRMSMVVKELEKALGQQVHSPE